MLIIIEITLNINPGRNPEQKTYSKRMHHTDGRICAHH
jgi:hypothetical protein